NPASLPFSAAHAGRDRAGGPVHPGCGRAADPGRLPGGPDRLAAPASAAGARAVCGDGGGIMIARFRRVLTVRRCRPPEYVLRVLGELVSVPAGLAVVQWVTPAFRVRGHHLPPVGA